MGKCCHCCSFDSLGCRLRTLKVFGALLFIFGTVFALAGIAIGFLSDFYFGVVALPDVFPEYILYAYLVVTTGVVALGTGLAAVYIAKTMSDDDCSTRGLAILALLTIVCSLATVGVPAWPLYEGGYFLGIPAQTSMNLTTSIAATTTPFPMTDAQTPIIFVVNPNATVTNGTSVDTNGTAANETASTNATVSSNSTSNETSSMSTGGANMTSSNMTSDNMTSSNMTSSNMTSSNMTSSNMTSSNMTSDNSTDTVSTPDSNNTVTSDSPMTTQEVTPGTTEIYQTGNSTAYVPTREPIDYDEWLLVVAPFGIISIFAFIFVFFCLFIFCIACCCPERSELPDEEWIVDDMDLYKS